MFDVLLMILSGGIAYLLLKAKIMPAGIALGLVLGRIIEENLIVTLYRTQRRTRSPICWSSRPSPPYSWPRASLPSSSRSG